MCVYLFECEVSVFFGAEVVHGDDTQQPPAFTILIIRRREGELPPRPVDLRETDRGKNELTDKNIQLFHLHSPSFVLKTLHRTRQACPGYRLLWKHSEVLPSSSMRVLISLKSNDQSINQCIAQTNIFNIRTGEEMQQAILAD